MEDLGMASWQMSRKQVQPRDVSAANSSAAIAATARSGARPGVFGAKGNNAGRMPAADLKKIERILGQWTQAMFPTCSRNIDRLTVTQRVFLLPMNPRSH
jgi:hypothetical protein